MVAVYISSVSNNRRIDDLRTDRNKRIDDLRVGLTRLRADMRDGFGKLDERFEPHDTALTKAHACPKPRARAKQAGKVHYPKPLESKS